MKRILLLALVALGLAVSARASRFDFTQNDISVTTTAQTITVGTSTAPMSAVTIVNNGAATDYVYARFFRTGETIVAAAASSTGGYKLAGGGTALTRSAPSYEGRPGYVAVSIVASGTSTVNVWATAR